MHLKQNIQLSGNKMEGYVDYGLNSKFNQLENPAPAFEALTFLTVPFEKFCKIPTSYYFINKLTGEMQPEFIKAGLTI